MREQLFAISFLVILPVCFLRALYLWNFNLIIHWLPFKSYELTYLLKPVYLTLAEILTHSRSPVTRR